MNYKELYKANIDRMYCDITGIKEANVRAESHPLQTIRDNWIILLGALAVIVGFLLVSFNLQNFLLVMAFIVLFLALYAIGNKFSVECSKNELKINQHFQNINLPYQSIKNVYVARTPGSILKTYVLVVRCVDKLSLIREFEFPLLCCNAEQISKFVNNFKIGGESSAETIKQERRRSLKQIVNTLFRLTASIIIAWFLISKGIIKLP